MRWTPPLVLCLCVALAPPCGAQSAAEKGINAGELAMLDGHVRQQQIRQFGALGVCWVRLDFDWSAIQPDSARTYDWARYDATVSGLSAAGLRVLGLLAYTPSWANGGKASRYFPPQDSAAFARFAQQAAARYGPHQVQAWEIWNEPNLAQFWQPAADPDAYAELLKGASAAIRAAAPGALVISGGLAQPYPSERDWDARQFLARFYAAGAGPFVDGIGNHPYTTPQLPSSPLAANWRKMGDASPSMRDIMIRNGDGGKRIWITEFGAPTAGTSPYPVVVTEWRQARMVEDAYRMGRRSPWSGPVFWYNYADYCPLSATAPSECFYGLVRHDGSPKPAYAAFRAVPPPYGRSCGAYRGPARNKAGEPASGPPPRRHRAHAAYRPGH